jgi:pullulanase
MKKRITAFLLCILMVVSVISNIGVANNNVYAAGTKVTEAWVNSGKEEVLTTPLDGATPYVEVEKDTNTAVKVDGGNNIQINLHYHRYDEVYDGWNVWFWPKDGEGKAYDFNGEDKFDKVLTVNLDNTEGLESVGFIIRLNEWEKKDYDSDRFIDLSLVKDNKIDVYLLQGDSKIYTDISEIDLSPKFLSASFYNSSEIKFSLTVPIDTTKADEVSHYKVTDEAGKVYKITKVWSKELGIVNNASLIMEEKLDLSKQYTISRNDYGEKEVSMGEAFSTKEFEDAFYYDGNDLGSVYTKEATRFRVWAPTASDVKLNLYKEGLGDSIIKSVVMTKDVKGTWVHTENSDLSGSYYTYSVTVNGVTKEATDPYAKTTGANGKRGMVLDLSATNPSGWDSVSKPTVVNATDAVIYELHVRDISSDSSSGIKNTGKYLGLTEKGTVNSVGLPTGLDHLLDLGITHLHLLPSFDYASVDETKLDENQFNWGYDPENYNVPEGSYSTNPYHGEVRVNEFKQMVKALHENKISVVMDVVYNHTSATADSNFNKIVPDYYYRKDGEVFSNGSGCGNETASERAMVRKYIVDSVVYWATEYKIDGFRFDLMALHDIDTMNAVRKALDKIDPSIIIYGEGWTGGNTTLPEHQRALKANASKLNGIAVFSDDIRDGIKGSVFVDPEKGFIGGKEGMEDTIRFGIVGSTMHSGIDYSKVNYSNEPWANAPVQTVNYASAHDNLSLWDKLAFSNYEDSVEDRIKMNKLSSAIVLTSQGIPFFQAGEEILRSKVKEDRTYDHNSYKSPDSVNSIKWDTKSANIDVYNYYKGLIAFRKAHPALRMTTTEEVQNNLRFVEDVEANVVAYEIKNSPNGESAESIFVIHNSNKHDVTIDLPNGIWNVYVNGEKAGIEILSTITDGKAKVSPISTLVLTQGEDIVDGGDKTMLVSEVAATKIVEKGNVIERIMPYVLIVVAVIAVIGIVVVVRKGKKRK